MVSDNYFYLIIIICLHSYKVSSNDNNDKTRLGREGDPLRTVQEV